MSTTAPFKGGRQLSYASEILEFAVLKWADASCVHEAMSQWAEKRGCLYSEVIAIGYFGSYAQRDWGVGSDVDILVVVEDSPDPFERRRLKWDTIELPVPSDLIIYTKKEWQSAENQQRFANEKMNLSKYILQHLFSSYLVEKIGKFIWRYLF